MKATSLTLLSLMLMLSVLTSCKDDTNPIELIPNINTDTTTVDTVKTITVGEVSFDMLYVKGGMFIMGAQNGNTSGQNYNVDASENEKPVHKVVVSDYYIGEFEVTQELWQAVMNGTPATGGSQWTESEGLGNDYPAYYVEYDSIMSFISKLNTLTGKTFRLPTEAEWEFAARGGASVSSQTPIYSGSNDIDSTTWYLGNCSKLQTVGLKFPNKLGIYDMCGNVYEWCSDWFGDYPTNQQTDPTGPSTGEYKILRGGCWDIAANYCRITARNTSNPTIENGTNNRGFRLVLVP